jgi:hypothetical protein
MVIGLQLALSSYMLGVHTAGNLEAWQAGKLSLLGIRDESREAEQSNAGAGSKASSAAAGGEGSGRATAAGVWAGGGGWSEEERGRLSDGGGPGASQLTGTADTRGETGAHPPMASQQGLNGGPVGGVSPGIGQPGHGFEIERAAGGRTDGWADEEEGKLGEDEKPHRNPFARKVELLHPFL